MNDYIVRDSRIKLILYFILSSIVIGLLLTPTYYAIIRNYDEAFIMLFGMLFFALYPAMCLYRAIRPRIRLKIDSDGIVHYKKNENTYSWPEIVDVEFYYVRNARIGIKLWLTNASFPYYIPLHALDADHDEILDQINSRLKNKY